MKSKTITQNDKVVKEQCKMSRSSKGQGHNAVKRSWPKQQCTWVWSKLVDLWKSY